jgi:hypothetical protein
VLVDHYGRACEAWRVVTAVSWCIGLFELAELLACLSVLLVVNLCTTITGHLTAVMHSAKASMTLAATVVCCSNRF